MDTLQKDQFMVLKDATYGGLGMGRANVFASLDYDVRIWLILEEEITALVEVVDRRRMTQLYCSAMHLMLELMFLNFLLVW